MDFETVADSLQGLLKQHRPDPHDHIGKEIALFSMILYAMKFGKLLVLSPDAQCDMVWDKVGNPSRGWISEAVEKACGIRQGEYAHNLVCHTLRLIPKMNPALGLEVTDHFINGIGFADDAVLSVVTPPAETPKSATSHSRINGGNGG